MGGGDYNLWRKPKPGKHFFRGGGGGGREDRVGGLQCIFKGWHIHHSPALQSLKSNSVCNGVMYFASLYSLNFKSCIEDTNILFCDVCLMPTCFSFGW